MVTPDWMLDIIDEELQRVMEKREREEAERAEDKRRYDEAHPRYDREVKRRHD